MQPHESGALCGCTARCTARESAETSSTAREPRQLYRQPTVVVQVPLVLEASYGLYSDACGYSQRYNERYVPV